MTGLPDHTGKPGPHGWIHVYGDSYEAMIVNFEAWLIDHGIERRGAVFTRWSN